MGVVFIKAVFLFCILLIIRAIIKRLRKRNIQRIREEEQRELSCSKQLISDAGNNDRDAVLNMLE